MSIVGRADRAAVEELRGCEVLVEREALPAAAAHEYFREDLVGFSVCNLAGVELGRLTHFVEVPSGVLMVVRGTREYWLPACPPHLRRVDLVGQRIEVDWPADL